MPMAAPILNRVVLGIVLIAGRLLIRAHTHTSKVLMISGDESLPQSAKTEVIKQVCHPGKVIGPLHQPLLQLPAC